MGYGQVVTDGISPSDPDRSRRYITIAAQLQQAKAMTMDLQTSVQSIITAHPGLTSRAVVLVYDILAEDTGKQRHTSRRILNAIQELILQDEVSVEGRRLYPYRPS